MTNPSNESIIKINDAVLISFGDALYLRRVLFLASGFPVVALYGYIAGKGRYYEKVGVFKKVRKWYFPFSKWVFFPEVD